ncbi:hypothetical protein [Nonomuraea salmonea]|uniref:hypothetical protein n=1 Tax=Nonomuraea salmonea TaxID=46181 RepID=UPI0031ED8A9E
MSQRTFIVPDSTCGVIRASRSTPAPAMPPVQRYFITSEDAAWPGIDDVATNAAVAAKLTDPAINTLRHRLTETPITHK